MSVLDWTRNGGAKVWTRMMRAGAAMISAGVVAACAPQDLPLANVPECAANGTIGLRDNGPLKAYALDQSAVCWADDHKGEPNRIGSTIKYKFLGVVDVPAKEVPDLARLARLQTPEVTFFNLNPPVPESDTRRVTWRWKGRDNVKIGATSYETEVFEREERGTFGGNTNDDLFWTLQYAPALKLVLKSVYAPTWTVSPASPDTSRNWSVVFLARPGGAQ
jgi:hypothetical protein